MLKLGATLVVASVLTAGAPAHAALALGVAVMDPRSAGLPDKDVARVMDTVRAATAAALKGTDFVVAPVEALRKAQAEMSGCRVGTCDMQVARHQGSVAVMSLEVALVKGEYFVSLRLAETRDGAPLARQAPSGATLDAVVKQLAPAVGALVTALLASHKAAVEAMKHGEKIYRLLPAGAADAVASTTKAKTDGRRLVEDGDTVGLPKALGIIRPEVNACYEVLTQKKPKAKGRILLSVDVETAGNISAVDILEDELGNADMQACVKARVGRMKFSAAPEPWRIRFPLVFVRAGK
jgi:hypothetical protein